MAKKRASTRVDKNKPEKKKEHRKTGQKDRNQTCRCCKKGHDTAKHMMLRCPALHRPRTTTLQTTEKIWNRRQRECYRRQSTQEKYMTLLGKQMDCGATMKQQRQLDSAVKNMLSDMNTIRTEQHQLQPLTGKTYSRPPEETAQMAELWQEMELEREQRRDQEQRTDEEEEDKYESGQEQDEEEDSVPEDEPEEPGQDKEVREVGGEGK
jgi:hypothetical protein